MNLFDTNVLVYAFRADSPGHEGYREWLQAAVDSEEPFGLSDVVLSGFVRVVTHPKVFNPPAPVEAALAFAEALRSRPNCVPISPGARHWEIFSRFCRAAGAKGNLVADAFLAALAVESGCLWITADRDYARFPGLKWRHPLG